MIATSTSSSFDWDSLIGQETAVELLTQAIARNRIAPAYLFVGPSGVGKKLAAERFAEHLLARLLVHRQGNAPVVSSSNAPSNTARTDTARTEVIRQRVQQRNHPDLFWVEPTYLSQGKRLTLSEAIASGLKRRSPPQIRLEQIREISRFLSRPPLEAERAVVILDDAHTMAEAAANALLKTLEEPGQATLILIAPSIDSLLPTLISRCQRISFSRLSPAQMETVLSGLDHHDILQTESILAIAQGSPGEAIASWERLQSIPSELLESVTQPIHSLRMALERARQINKALDPEDQLWLIEYLQHHYWHQTYQTPAIQHLETARKHLLRYVQPRLVWETTFMALLESQSKH
ncbi:MAG: DNA polymerase III subunit delta' [Leptolyngbyaceae bacterium]|nr:DNA polymerase III subunit delta' [Leptolyngbyaceae bacterium]